MYRYLLALFCLVFAGCGPQNKGADQKTQLEIRELQTRMYDTQNFKLVMKSVLNVLQDENFIVKNVALDLGFLTATKEIDVEDPNAAFWAKFQRTDTARWRKNEVIDATVNVTEFGNQMRVRANFQSKVMDNKGAVVSVNQMVEDEFYQDFFSKVDKGIFIQQQNI